MSSPLIRKVCSSCPKASNGARAFLRVSSESKAGYLSKMLKVLLKKTFENTVNRLNLLRLDLDVYRAY